jgi:solute carrier family 25 protein 39/40
VGDNGQFCMVGQNGGPAVVHSSSTLAADCAVEETQRKTFTSTLDGLRKISRNEGALSLWRGLSPTLVMAIPANVIYFTGYDWMRLDHRSPIRRYVRDGYAPLVAGSVARIAAASVISPIEMFRTRLQATSGVGADHFKATLRGLHQMTQVQGYSSLWRGLTLTMWRDVPFSGLYWWGYETVRNTITDTRERARHGHLPSSADEPDKLNRRATQIQQDHTTTFIDSFIAGATSGALAALVTTPFDVGKTRQQVVRHASDDITLLPRTQNITALSSASVSSTLNPTSSLRPEQLSIPRFLLHIFREEGLPGLFRGWTARCLKVAPACAIMISSYEIGKKMARDVNERKGSDGV